MCKICGIIGITSINSGTPYTAKRPKKARPQKVHYNFGNNVAYIDRSLAKEELLERYYVKILLKISLVIHFYYQLFEN